MQKEICLVEVKKRSDGSFRTVTEIHRYESLNIPQEDEIVVLPSDDKLFVVKKIYHFTHHNTVTCVGYVLEDSDKGILTKSIKMLVDVLKDGYR